MLVLSLSREFASLRLLLFLVACNSTLSCLLRLCPDAPCVIMFLMKMKMKMSGSLGHVNWLNNYNVLRSLDFLFVDDRAADHSPSGCNWSSISQDERFEKDLLFRLTMIV